MVGLAIFLCLLACNPAAAQAQPTSPAEPARAPSSSYLLRAGDRVVVTILGQPDLTGELPIDGDGDIPLPLLGSVHVEGLTTQQAQELIRSRLANGYLVSPSVSVRLGEPRPLYILGSVRSPGAYPFRFGTVIRAAIAAAGGYAVSDPLRSQAVVEAMAADERVRQLVLEHAALLIRQARLQAQMRGGASFAVPNLPERPPEDKLTQIVTTEQETLTSQLQIVRAQVDLLEAQKPRVHSQIEAKESEMASATRRLDLLRGETQRSEALVQQGIGTRTVALQSKFQEATEETNIWRLKGEISNLQRELGDLDVRIQNEELSLRKQVIAELQTVSSRIMELEMLTPAAREQRDWRVQQAGGLLDPAGGYHITITRVQAGVARVMIAGETTLVEPGDVIEVTPIARRPGEAFSSFGNVRRSDDAQWTAQPQLAPIMLPVTASAPPRDIAPSPDRFTTPCQVVSAATAPLAAQTEAAMCWR